MTLVSHWSALCAKFDTPTLIVSLAQKTSTLRANSSEEEELCKKCKEDETCTIHIAKYMSKKGALLQQKIAICTLAPDQHSSLILHNQCSAEPKKPYGVPHISPDFPS